MDTASVAHLRTDSRSTPEAKPRLRCAGCGEPARKLAPLHGARTGPELRALSLLGPCCNPRLRPRNLQAGIFEGL